MKHIRMTETQWNLWETGMLSGEYPKSTGQLQRAEGFCCLGVLQMVLTGKTQVNSDGGTLGYPTHCWLEEQGITFLNSFGNVSGIPFIEAEKMNITHLNDMRTASDITEQQYNFKEISAFLRTEVEFI